MDRLTTRPYEPRDEDGYYAVRSITYNDGLPIEREARDFRYSRPFVCEVAGEICGIYNVLDMTASRGEAILKCGGIASVAVLPHKRRLGIGRKMMDWSVQRLRDEGTPLSSLYAFREPFYRRSGFETVGKRLRITCPSHRLPKVKSDLGTRLLTPADWKLLVPCYKAYARKHSGLNVRTELFWNRVLNEHHPLAIYAVGDPIEAYAAVRHRVDFWEPQHVTEVVWSSLRGYEALMVVLAGLAINKTELSWYELSDSPFVTRFMDQGVSIELQRPIMYRVTDVPAALRQLKTQETGAFDLEVVDDLIPENCGPWHVGFSPSGVDVQPAKNADLTTDVRQLAQALLGEPSWRDLAANGFVVVKEDRALSAAEKLMPAMPATCLDFF